MTMIGAYGLFRRGTDYALVSATTFIGETEIDNHVLGSTGAYDTVGYALTGTVGHIFMLTETLRFDLRGGALWASFEGDEFEDSQGNSFGTSKVSFGAIKFEPGIYGDFNPDNGNGDKPLWPAGAAAAARLRKHRQCRRPGVRVRRR